MENLLTILHVLICVMLILVVLIQSGKGAEISASFGGSSQTVFGSSGGANFFTRFTAVTAFLFMTTSVALTLLGSQHRKSVFDTQAPSAQTQNAAPTQPTAVLPNPGAPKAESKATSPEGVAPAKNPAAPTKSGK